MVSQSRKSCSFREICRVLVLILLASLAVGQAWAQDQEILAKQMEAELIAPCCWRQPVAVHESGASQEVRREIRELLAQGLNREQVLASFVDRYGVQILAAPPATGIYRSAYWIPALAVLLGVLLVLLYWRAHKVSRAPEASSEVLSRSDPAEVERVRREVLDQF